MENKEDGIEGLVIETLVGTQELNGEARTEVIENVVKIVEVGGGRILSEDEGWVVDVDCGRRVDVSDNTRDRTRREGMGEERESAGKSVIG